MLAKCSQSNFEAALAENVSKQSQKQRNLLNRHPKHWLQGLVAINLEHTDARSLAWLANGLVPNVSTQSDHVLFVSTLQRKEFVQASFGGLPGHEKLKRDLDSALVSSLPQRVYLLLEMFDLCLELRNALLTLEFLHIVGHGVQQ